MLLNKSCCIVSTLKSQPTCIVLDNASVEMQVNSLLSCEFSFFSREPTHRSSVLNTLWIWINTSKSKFNLITAEYSWQSRSVNAGYRQISDIRPALLSVLDSVLHDPLWWELIEGSCLSNVLSFSLLLSCLCPHFLLYIQLRMKDINCSEVGYYELTIFYFI